MKKIPERNEIAQKDKWAIEDLYASPALWQEDLKKLQELGQKLAVFSGKLHISAHCFAYRGRGLHWFAHCG